MPGQFTSYMLVNSVANLQNMVDPGGPALRGSYALGKDISGGAFTAHTFTFRGDFDGLNHTISGLTINGTGTVPSQLRHVPQPDAERCHR